jgi:hypothetical protein
VKRRVNIEIHDSIDLYSAVKHVAQVMERGRVSEYATTYCLSTIFTDGVVVSARIHDKRRTNSDSFVVHKRSVGA